LERLRGLEQRRLALGAPGLHDELLVARVGDGRQDRHHDHHDHQFDQREAALFAASDACACHCRPLRHRFMLSRPAMRPRAPATDSDTDSTPPEEPLDTLYSFGAPVVIGGVPLMTVGIGVMPTCDRRPLTATAAPEVGCDTRSPSENTSSLSTSNGDADRRLPPTASISISQLVPPLSHGLVDGISVGKTTRPKRICGGYTTRSPVSAPDTVGKSRNHPRWLLQSTVWLVVTR